MKWIADRNPSSPGMYAVRSTNTLLNFEIEHLFFMYWDGQGWKAPRQFDDRELCLYRGEINKPIWAVIEWGKDA